MGRQDFFLTGGAALSVFYLERRLSYDLDLFTRGSIEWPPLEKLLESRNSPCSLHAYR